MINLMNWIARDKRLETTIDRVLKKLKYYLGEVATDWAKDSDNSNLIQVAIDHKGQDTVIPGDGISPDMTVHSYYSIATQQDNEKIGITANWCIAQFYLDETTYNALALDSNYLINWAESENV